MIAIVDSGVANLASVAAALVRLGAEAEVTAEAEKLCAADRVILPGVGAAPAAMRELAQRGLIDVLKSLTQPVLGICLGMQLMFEASAEGGATPCLGLIPGTVRKLTGDEPLPHMGWNEIEAVQADHPLLKSIAPGSYMYFVHSFAVPPGPAMIARCTYSEPFTAMCGHKNFFGCQFHPERSGAAGAQVLKNFLEMET